MYSFVSYLYVSCSGSITSVGEDRANLSAVVYFLLCGFCSERFPFPLGAWDGLRYFIVSLPEPSIYLFYLLILWEILFLRSIMIGTGQNHIGHHPQPNMHVKEVKEQT